MIDSSEYRQFLGKARDAVSGGHEAWAAQSTGEQLAVALALNRADWLASLSYTVPEALERIGPAWAALVPRIARVLKEDGTQLAAAVDAVRQAEATEAVLSAPEVDLAAELVTYGSAPGYRDAELGFQRAPAGIAADHTRDAPDPARRRGTDRPPPTRRAPLGLATWAAPRSAGRRTASAVDLSPHGPCLTGRRGWTKIPVEHAFSNRLS